MLNSVFSFIGEFILYQRYIPNGFGTTGNPKMTPKSIHLCKEIIPRISRIPSSQKILPLNC